jgi:hypothetical protein
MAAGRQNDVVLSGFTPDRSCVADDRVAPSTHDAPRTIVWFSGKNATLLGGLKNIPNFMDGFGNRTGLRNERLQI